MRTNWLYILGVILFALLGQTLQAGPVSRGQALEIGKRILEQPATRSGDSEIGIVWDGEFADGTATADPAFYVIGRKSGGFVIISANDNARPILALSKTNSFQTEGMPSNVRWWMERLKAYVRAQVTPVQGARALWAGLMGTRADDASIIGTITDKVEHLTPEWDQGSYDSYYFKRQVFNKFCPMMNGELTITGCVATAIAEVLTVLSDIYPDDMPSHGKGTVGGYEPYDPSGVAPEAYELTTVYDWANLRTLTNTSAIKKAVNEGKNDLLDNLGHLLADCGTIVEACYNLDWTGAYTGENITSKMADHFYMSKDAHVEYADSYSFDKWKKMIKADLNTRPVIYNGQDPEYGGHAFVLDGYGLYGSEEVFHVNFGWSGGNNGYYFLDHLDSGYGVYDNECDVILDFVPDVRQLVPDRIELTLASDQEYHGFTIPESIPFDEYTWLVFGRLKNTGNVTYDGSLYAYLQKKGGELIEIGSTGIGGLTPSWWFTQLSIGIRIPSDTSVSVGDRIVLYYTALNDERVPVQYARDGSVIGEVPLFPAAFIQTENRYMIGDSFKFRLINQDCLYSGTVWTITDPDGTIVSKSQADESYRFPRPGKYRIQAAIAPSPGDPVVENVVTFVTVQ